MIGMLWFVCFFNYADRQAISSVLPLLKKEFGFGAVELGWIGSSFAWVYAFMSPFAGVTADRFPRKAIIIAACIIWSCLTLATGFCNGLLALLIVRALTGLSETFYFPAAVSLISDYHGTGTRSRALSWHQSAVYAGTILGSWAAAVWAEDHGWRAPFYLFGPAGVLLALFLARFLRESERKPSEEPVFDAVENAPSASRPQGFIAERMNLFLRRPAALLLMAGFLCANFVAVIFLSWTPDFLVEKFHYSIGVAGLNGTIYIHLASALSVPLAGWIADRLNSRLPASRMAVQAAGLLIGSIFIFLVGHTSSTVTLRL